MECVRMYACLQVRAGLLVNIDKLIVRQELIDILVDKVIVRMPAVRLRFWGQHLTCMFVCWTR